MIPTFKAFLSKDLGVFSVTALFSIVTSINTMFECKFLLIHLSYYIIAHYVKLVALQSDVEDGELPVTYSERYE
jgi:gustatory receptor